MDKEFMENCMSRRTKVIDPSATEISNPVEINNLSKSHKLLSSYFLEGAKSALASTTPLLSILLGYFAMEQKTYELLARKGLKVTSHVCAIMGLSRVVERKDLASVLSKAYDNRLEVNYLGNIKTAELDRERANKFMAATATPFIDEIEKMISKL